MYGEQYGEYALHTEVIVWRDKDFYLSVLIYTEHRTQLFLWLNLLSFPTLIHSYTILHPTLSLVYKFVFSE